MLDDGRRRRYCRIIFAGCSSQPPPHRSTWSTFGPAVSGHGSFPDSQLTFLVVCSCDVTSAKPMTEPDCISASGQVQIRPSNSSSESSRCHGGTPVRSRCVGRCAQRAHHCEQQRHRRSEWAGVSWPKDDDHERDAADGTGLARRRGTRDTPTMPQTLHCKRSSVRWRDRPHASAERWN